MCELNPKIVLKTCVWVFFSFGLSILTSDASSYIMQLVLVANDPENTVCVDLPLVFFFFFKKETLRKFNVRLWALFQTARK